MQSFEGLSPVSRGGEVSHGDFRIAVTMDLLLHAFQYHTPPDASEWGHMAEKTILALL